MNKSVYIGDCSRCHTEYELELSSPEGVTPPPTLSLGCRCEPTPQPFAAGYAGHA